jgi:hypothetical protein
MIYDTDTPAEQLFLAKIVARLGADLAQELTAKANANLDDADAQREATEAAQLVSDLQREIRKAEAEAA